MNKIVYKCCQTNFINKIGKTNNESEWVLIFLPLIQTDSSMFSVNSPILAYFSSI